MEVKVESGRCRCCYSETAGSGLVQLGTNYVDMLMDTFRIVLSNTFVEANVCDGCAVRLQDASNFKKLVLKTEQRFRHHFPSSSRSSDNKPLALKLEVDDTQSESDFGGDDLNDPDYTDEDCKPLVEMVTSVESKPASVLQMEANVRKALALGRRTRLIYKTTQPRLRMDKLHKVNRYVRSQMEKCGDDFAPSVTRLSVEERTKPVTQQMRVPRFKLSTGTTANKLVSRLKVSDVDPETANVVGADLLPAEKRATRKIILQNALAILRNTTACPFIYYHSNFRCFYCRETFFDFNLLKAHTSEVHSDVKQEARKVSAFRDLMMVDISDLRCRKCDQRFQDVNSIKNHLISHHGVAINLKHNDDIAAFKIDSHDFKCHLCGEEFHVFRNLSLHLNKHYANYMCDICGKPFISWERYKNHENTHVNGRFKCAKCAEVFSTLKARAAHSVSEHRVTRYGCPLCSERFEKYLERTVHMSSVHNITHKFKCPQCAKEFFHKPHMRAHFNNTHRTREKKVECSECGMKFTDNNSLSRHMVSHTGEKLFACRLCGKKYGRKYSLTEHMRAHSKPTARRPGGLMDFQ